MWTNLHNRQLLTLTFCSKLEMYAILFSRLRRVNGLYLATIPLACRECALVLCYQWDLCDWAQCIAYMRSVRSYWRRVNSDARQDGMQHGWEMNSIDTVPGRGSVFLFHYLKMTQEGTVVILSLTYQLSHSTCPERRKSNFYRSWRPSFSFFLPLS
jgi:hypothetical protein